MRTMYILICMIWSVPDRKQGHDALHITRRVHMEHMIKEIEENIGNHRETEQHWDIGFHTKNISRKE